MSQESGLIVRPDFARLYCRRDDPKRMELKPTNLKKIPPGGQVWLLTCGRIPGYKEVLGKLTFEGAEIIMKDEFDMHFKQHQCRISELPTTFATRHGKEFLWGWRWSSFQPFAPSDGKAFLPNKKGTVTWVNFAMHDLVGPPPLRPPSQPRSRSLSQHELRLPSQSRSRSPSEQELRVGPESAPPQCWNPRQLIPRLAVCEFCRRRFPPERFPFHACFYCGASPSWHHGRCCPQRPRRR